MISTSPNPTTQPEFVSWLIQAHQKYEHLYMVQARVAHSRDTQIVVFRPLTQREVDMFASIAEMGEVMDDVVRTAVLYPEWDRVSQVLPGSFEMVANTIVEVSGFNDPKAIKEGFAYAQQSSMTLTSAIQVFICKAFSNYTPHDVANMDLMSQLQLLAKAQYALGTEFPMKDFFKPPKKAPGHNIDWGRLKTLTPAEIEAMRGGAYDELQRTKAKQARIDRKAREHDHKLQQIAERRQQALARTQGA